ncbi:MAG TPA: hypothetical protein VFP21_10460 [Solirubrobacterales bacterium]|nr:hypothetical protein [Solirubrobacterales bacterium]
MAVMARELWTDERLDDLNKKVDSGFMEMRTEFRAIRAEMQSEFQAVRGEIQGVRDEVATMNRNLIQLTWGLIGMMLVGFLGIIATILTQV